MEKELNKLIFGRNDTKGIVSCEVDEETGNVELFVQDLKTGEVHSQFITDNKYWLLSDKRIDNFWYKMKGDLHYKYFRHCEDWSDFKRKRYFAKKDGYDTFSIWNSHEAAMVTKGFTYFKSLKVQDVSVLSFDIETTGLDPKDPLAKVLIITNTFRDHTGKIKRRLFCYDDFKNEGEMIEAWCYYVRKMNPSVIIGHNIFGYDFPYLIHRGAVNGVRLRLGRDNGNEPIEIENWEANFRFDGNTSYTFKRLHIYGREIIDTMFLAMKYDIGRKYPNYKLKDIITYENLEVENRQHYDASQIKNNYLNESEWEKIKQYAIHDGDDALELYDLMIPPFFYMTQSIPKPFQMVGYTASGSQINSMMLRSYLQSFHSIPKASEVYKYEGAISYGNKGVYTDVVKIDVASLYPSLILSYDICNKIKDPNQNFLQMVNYFTKQRLKNKSLYKETKDTYYNDLQAAQKVVINSFYGFMGANGLIFNSPEHAEEITRRGRETLQYAIAWAEMKGYQIVNCDTDSISYTCYKPIPKEIREKDLEEINSLYPNTCIKWEDDGYFQKVLVLKAKNYVLVYEDGKRRTKGSALLATMKPQKLKDFIQEVIDCLLEKNYKKIKMIYSKYIYMITNMNSIDGWCKRITLTEKIFNPKRTNEQKVLDAIQNKEVNKGDKIFVYFDYEEKLKLQDDWSKDHHIDRLYEGLYKTIKTFKELIPEFESIPNFKLKKNKKNGLLDKTLKWHERKI